MKQISIILLWVLSLGGYAQTDSLPFKISEGKRISEAKLQKKKEGYYVTGLPRFAYDPIQGIGLGVDAEIFNNGKKEDPFFAYTPYRQRFKVSLWAAENGKIAANIGVDIPYIFNTKWRFRTTFAFADNPNKLYFGMGEERLAALDEAPFNGAGPFYGDYNRALRQLRPGMAEYGEDPGEMYTDRRLHYLHYRKYALDLILERTYLDGDLRVLGALGFTHLAYTNYDFNEIDDAHDANGNEVTATNGTTQITRDYRDAQTNPGAYWNRYNITGYEGGLSIKFKAGVIYDTRDFEPDPYKGTLLEYGFGATDQFMGSDFSYTRHMLQGLKFIPLFRYGAGGKYQSTLAIRAASSVIRGQDVFFREIFDVWSASQGRIGLLGGEDNLRGYKKFRFGAPVYGFGSFEWRTQFLNFNLFDQNWVISAVPFFDYGRTWDEIANINLRGFKYNGGMGMRIHWNQSTIIRLDYAVSVEDRQFFLVFGQMF
jgi:hypothetical protein